jgi:hypothetical protein
LGSTWREDHPLLKSIKRWLETIYLFLKRTFHAFVHSKLVQCVLKLFNRVRVFLTSLLDTILQSKVVRFLLRQQSLISITASLLAIFIGLMIGYVIMLLFNPEQANEGFSFITGGWIFEASDLMRDFGRSLFTMGPLLMTGLSVGFAFKTGLFNIGATGQYTLGMFVAIWIGFYGQGLGDFQWIAGVLGGMRSMLPAASLAAAGRSPWFCYLLRFKKPCFHDACCLSFLASQ